MLGANILWDEEVHYIRQDRIPRWTLRPQETFEAAIFAPAIITSRSGSQTAAAINGKP